MVSIKEDAENVKAITVKEEVNLQSSKIKTGSVTLSADLLHFV
jgi:hypothetical protein